MNKEKLENKLKEITAKSKKLADKIISAVKEIREELKRTKGKALKTLKEKHATDSSKKQSLSKTKKQQKGSTVLDIYDKKEPVLKPARSLFSIKPMSSSGQKVNFGKSIFTLGKNFSLFPKVCFCAFSVKIIFLGSAFISAWLLGLSFDQETKAFSAFIAFFLIGLSIRYIKTLAGSLCYGFLTGFFANIFIFEWIFDTVLGGISNYLLATGALLGLSLILALPFMLFTLFAWQYKHKLSIYPFASACAWVAIEIIVQLISYKGLGFPWFVLGYTQYANLELIQVSSLLGAYGVSFFIVFCSFCATLVLGKTVTFRRRLINFLLIAIIWCTYTSYGKRQLSAVSTENKTLRTAIVQPNTHFNMLQGDKEEAEQTLNSIALFLQEAKPFDLIIWPESTIPGYLEEGPLKDFMAKLSSDTQAAQIAGASSQKTGSSKQIAQMQVPTEELVGAGLYEEGGLVAKHHKRKLVPFGEFLPFEKQLDTFYRNNSINSLTGSFVEGSGPAQALTLKTGEGQTSLGIQICFESIFPILWRLEALGGAEFFVNISNDGWFLNTAAPYQHLRINVFRAVENRKPVLRSANSGISAYIDAFGRIQRQIPLNQEDIEIVELILPVFSSQTFYTIYGDIFALLCLFLTLAFSFNCLEINQEYD